MTRKSSLLLAVVTALAVIAYGSVALAADAPAAAGAPAAKAAPPAAAKAAPAGKAAEKVPEKRIEATVTGKIESKTVTNKKGKEVKVCRVQVSSAKAADGAALDALKGKWLRVVGKKVADVEKFDGKEATLTGAVVADKRINVESVK